MYKRQTISGTGFSGATAVTFGGVAAQSFSVKSAISITAVSPAGSGVVDVQVTTLGGTSAVKTADHFTYTGGSSLPTVTSVSPTSGPTAGAVTASPPSATTVSRSLAKTATRAANAS